MVSQTPGEGKQRSNDDILEGLRLSGEIWDAWHAIAPLVAQAISDGMPVHQILDRIVLAMTVARAVMQKPITPELRAQVAVEVAEIKRLTHDLQSRLKAARQ